MALPIEKPVGLRLRWHRELLLASGQDEQGQGDHEDHLYDYTLAVCPHRLIGVAALVVALSFLAPLSAILFLAANHRILT